MKKKFWTVVTAVSICIIVCGICFAVFVAPFLAQTDAGTADADSNVPQPPRSAFPFEALTKQVYVGADTNVGRVFRSYAGEFEYDYRTNASPTGETLEGLDVPIYEYERIALSDGLPETRRCIFSGPGNTVIHLTDGAVTWQDLTDFRDEEGRLVGLVRTQEEYDLWMWGRSEASRILASGKLPQEPCMILNDRVIPYDAQFLDGTLWLPLKQLSNAMHLSVSESEYGIDVVYPPDYRTVTYYYFGVAQHQLAQPDKPNDRNYLGWQYRQYEPGSREPVWTAEMKMLMQVDGIWYVEAAQLSRIAGWDIRFAEDFVCINTGPLDFPKEVKLVEVPDRAW